MTPGLISHGMKTPSLFTLYRRPPRLGQSLVLGISQSGTSRDIVAVLAEALLRRLAPHVTPARRGRSRLAC